MTIYIDAHGREWETAEEALKDFLENLPPELNDGELEIIFQFTHHKADAHFNLMAIEYGIAYGGLSHAFDSYPIPHLKVEVEHALADSGVRCICGAEYSTYLRLNDHINSELTRTELTPPRGASN